MLNSTLFFFFSGDLAMCHIIFKGKRYQCPHGPKRSSWMNSQSLHLHKWQWQPRPHYTSKCISNVSPLFRWEQHQTTCCCPIWWSFFKIWQWCIDISKRQKHLDFSSLHLTQMASPSSLIRSIRNCILSTAVLNLNVSPHLWQSLEKVSWRYLESYGQSGHQKKQS